MKRQNIIHLIAGTLVFTSALLGYFHHQYWLFIAMFVGLNLFQYSLSNFCPLDRILEKLGFEN